MPLYEYRCKKCAHQFERIQKFSDKPVTRCPECGGRVEQLISPPAVQFKGEGWYVTDYARKSSPPSEGKSEGDGAAAKSESKSESKTETKSESKSESKSEEKPRKSHSHK